jgi:sec-independent protein translocase protein TatA
MPLLAGLGPLGVPELLIIAFIIVLIFGVGRLPEVGGAIGKGIREFRKSAKEGDPDVAGEASGVGNAASSVATEPSGAAAPEESRFCGECGTKNAGTAKFCAECGHSMSAMAR